MQMKWNAEMCIWGLCWTIC